MAVQKLGDVAVGSVVKLNVNNKPTNFIVIHQGLPSSGNYDSSCNGTWVLMQNIYNRQVWSGYNNDYENSDINTWLNTDFVAYLDEKIQEVLFAVKIPYRPGSGGSATVNSGANGLSVKAFLLSMKELGFATSESDYTPAEGAKLSYFSDSSNAKRIANFNGSPAKWWTRSPVLTGDDDGVWYILEKGTNQATASGTTSGVRPVLILPSTLFVSEDGTIFINDLPTAPGSIDVTGVVSGGTATMMLTEATDPDGTVESYIYERSVDGGEFQQFANANTLTQTDFINEEWGTVAYRAAAVDNLGAQGPYITSNTETVNVGWVTIGGPAESMGSKAVPFDFAFSVSVSGQSSTGAITVSAALDGKQVYSGTPNAGEQVTIPIKTHLLGAGTHTVEVQASKDDYLPASKRYTFTVPAVTIPDGGVGALAQGPDGRAVYHTTLAQRCIGRDGVDIQAQMDALAARVKTLEG